MCLADEVHREEYARGLADEHEADDHEDGVVDGLVRGGARARDRVKVGVRARVRVRVRVRVGARVRVRVRVGARVRVRVRVR